MTVLMNFSKRLLTGCLALGLGGCAGLGGRPAVTAQPPSVTGINASGLELGVDLHVENPNPFPLVANTVQGTLFLDDDKKVGTGSAKLDEPIAAKGAGDVQSQLDIAWSSAGALREFVGKSQVPFVFKGELGVSGGPVSMNVPFELRGSLSREQLISVGGSLLAPLFD
jgi:LEA14-like dessication related protein